MYAEILQVGFRNHGTDRIRHAADAQLQAGAIRDLLHDQLGHRAVNVGRRTAGAQLRDRRVLTLDDHIYLGDVDRFLKAAQAARHVLIDLDDDNVGHVAHCLQVGRVRAEAEVAVARPSAQPGTSPR